MFCHTNAAVKCLEIVFLTTMIKKTIFFLYCAIVVCMGAATITEKFNGSDFVGTYIYGTWWFSVLWGLLAGATVLYFLKLRVRHVSAVALHLSFLIILAGAFITHIKAKHGYMHLRMNDAVSTYYISGANGNIDEAYLPFTVELNSFDIKYHSGTDAVADYETKFTINDNGKETTGCVSMNKIFSYRSYRMYQNSYDPDKRGSILSVSHDPAGIPVTYAGYALLFFSLVWMLFDPRGAYRRILRSPVFKKGMLFLLSFAAVQEARALTVLPQKTAEEFGKINVLYGGRICPLQTLAIDFTKKLCGRAHYNGYTAEQVLTGFVLFGEEWNNEPILKIKGAELKEKLHLSDYVSVNALFDNAERVYILGPFVEGYFGGDNRALNKQAADIDDRLQLIMDLQHGSLLKIFPITEDGKTVWYSPADENPVSADTLRKIFMQNVLTLISQEASAGNMAEADAIIGKIVKHQKRNAGSSLPSERRIKAERIYNAVPFATVLFMVNLAMGLIALLYTIYVYTSAKTPRFRHTANAAMLTVMCLSLAALTFCLALRWTISGTVPMSNGYETMLNMAWFTMVVSLTVYKRFRITLAFGFLLSGLLLLVSHISQMNPQISHIMPVLSSPLLSIHVSVIMMSFALLSFTFVCGLAAIAIRLTKRGRNANNSRIKALQVLSQLFLYPAIAALGIGIFIGAVWANISWGTYWNWDPKEVWALITFMVYAIALHTRIAPALKRPMTYHIFMAAAFLTIIMTYFGVNYLLGGMHSYA